MSSFEVGTLVLGTLMFAATTAVPIITFIFYRMTYTLSKKLVDNDNARELRVEEEKKKLRIKNRLLNYCAVVPGGNLDILYAGVVLIKVGYKVTAAIILEAYEELYAENAGELLSISGTKLKMVLPDNVIVMLRSKGETV